MTERDFSHSPDVAHCKAWTCGSADTSSESQSSGIPIRCKVDTKTFSLDKAKLVLSKPSSFSNDTLYDHLVEIIKRVIDERPSNVINYFEQFSRDVRERRLCTSHIAPAPDSEFLKIAKAVLDSIGLGRSEGIEVFNEEIYEDRLASPTAVSLSSASTLTKMHRTLSTHKNVIQLLHYWGVCGLSFQADEAFLLSWTIQKIQHHRSVSSARFWGKIFGAGASYFVVEADLTKSETMLRMDYMEAKIVDEMIAFLNKKEMSTMRKDIDTELIPGTHWQDHPESELRKMQQQAAPVPTYTVEEPFEMPPEPTGTGLNRKTYFVTQCLSDEWKELPIVTPQQIDASRKIRKFFTGNLEANLSCYPTFPGTEKNYLRAMIARITAGSYIAPESYFRKMTKKEKLMAECEGEQLVNGEGEEGSIGSDIEDEFDENITDNDWPIIENETYDPLPLNKLKLPRYWVHCRPHILEQGTVTYIDKEVIIRNLMKVALRRMREQEMGVLEDVEDEGGDNLDIISDVESDAEHDEEENVDEEQNLDSEPGRGPGVFTSAREDRNSEDVNPWSSRFTEYCNSVNQTIIMRSNLWPGAYTFIHEKCCDSIYFGWGTKFMARCGAIDHLPEIQNIHYPDNMLEVTDPSVEMEDNWRRFNLKKNMIGAAAGGEEISFSVEFDNDDDYDDVDG